MSETSRSCALPCQTDAPGLYTKDLQLEFTTFSNGKVIFHFIGNKRRLFCEGGTIINLQNGQIPCHIEFSRGASILLFVLSFSRLLG